MVTFSSGGAILCLHSLTAPDLPSNGSANLPLESFARLVAAVRRVATIVPLPEMLAQHRSGRRTSGLVALTFDDAYASLLPASALITALSIPLTVFVASHAAATGVPYWWDRVDDLYPHVEGQRWRRFESDLGLPESFRRGQPREYGPLRPLRQWILAAHAGRWPVGTPDLLTELENEAGVRTRHRSMSFPELVGFAANDLVDVGVHTESHPVLPLLPAAEALGEIARSHAAIRAMVGKTIPVLAFPYGLFDGRTVEIAREAGMEASLSVVRRTIAGYAGDATLPRFCLTNQEKPWKLVLRVTGLGERLLPWRLEPRAAYPVLPSETT